MFIIKSASPSNGVLKPVMSGIRFGGFNEPINFDISTDFSPEPLKFSFTAKFDKSQPNYSVKADFTSEEHKEYAVIFYNPIVPGRSGLISPTSVLTFQKKWALVLMFWVETMQDSGTYQLVYEFYEEILPTSEQKEEAPK